MASLKDIATALNLSIPLVSKVLSGKMGTTGCSEANRLAILAKAKELDFRPNLLARALRNGRTGSIGVFVHPLGSPGSDLIEHLLMGLSAQTNALGQRLFLSFYETDNEFLQNFTKTARAEIDGLLVIGISHPELISLYGEIEKNGTPVVTMLKDAVETTERPNVYCDDFQVGYLPTRHLLENGCRRIAHIRSMDSRCQGYLKALQEYGLPEDPALIYTAMDSFDTDTGRKAVQHWIGNQVQFDGLVAESDHQAFGGIVELLAQGRRVPEDVKVFGVDNSDVCTLSPVPLSSVSQQMEEVGARGVDAIMQRINEEPAESIKIQPVLRLRASSGD